MTEELLAAGGRLCQMWGSTCLGFGVLEAAGSPCCGVCPSTGPRSSPDLELARRELRPSAIVLPLLEQSVVACLLVIIA